MEECQGALMQPPGPPWMKNKSTKTWSAWEGKVADLSKEMGQQPVPQWAFIGINLHRNIGKAHPCQPVRVKQYMIYREL